MIRGGETQSRPLSWLSMTNEGDAAYFAPRSDDTMYYDTQSLSARKNVTPENANAIIHA